MDFGFIQKHLSDYIDAALLTLRIGGIGILFSVLTGFFCSLIRYYKIPVVSRIIGMYIELSRNTPLLIQLFFLYYGLPKVGIRLDAEVCAVIGLTFLGGSYMAESFRSGFEAVARIQTEAGLSIGLTRWQLMIYVILPQAVAIALPSLGANMIFLLKETSLFSAVALADLMFVAKDLIGMYYKTTESLFMLVCAYSIILIPILLLLYWLERKVRYAGFGN